MQGNHQIQSVPQCCKLFNSVCLSREYFIDVMALSLQGTYATVFKGKSRSA